jgi:hypothetical protein
MPSLRSLLLPLLLACASACTDRTHPHSELGHDFAAHFCPVHDQCGCEEEIPTPIPSCETRVEQEFLASERRALAAGLELDPACFADVLDDIETFTACGRPSGGPYCPVYTAHADEGASCEIYDFWPWMTDCRAGLRCVQGFCRNIDDPIILHEGEICSDTQADRATGWLGRCADGFVCDSEDTRTCVPNPYWPPVPTGGVCTTPFICMDESYCHTDDPEEGPSEEHPGVCTIKTLPGQPCDNLVECTAFCTDGICEAPRPMMCEAVQAWWARDQLADEMLMTNPRAPTVVRP